MHIRKIQPEDAEAFLVLNHRLDAETKTMLLEPGERNSDVESLRKRIEHTVVQSNEAIFVAEEDGVLIGYVSIIGGHLQRMTHKASIVTGVLPQYGGKGVGTQLFTFMLKWTESSSLYRLELTVMTHNEPAIALYKKFGFQIEGTKRASLKVDGNYVDEYVMSLLLRR